MPTGVANKMQQASALCEQGRWPEALDFARRWQAEAPDAARAFFYESLALTGLGQFPAAAVACQQALRWDDHDFNTWNHLAMLQFHQLDQPAEGAKCLEQAMRIDPGNKLGWLNLAGMYLRLGRPAQVLDCAERALALDPELVEAHLQRARAAQALNKSEIVRAASEALSRLAPGKFTRAA